MFKPLQGVSNKDHFLGKRNKPGDPIQVSYNSSARKNRGTNQCIPYSRVVPTRANLGRVTTGDAVFLYSERSTKTKRSAFSGTNEPSIIIGIDRANKELEKRESQTALEHQDDSTDSKAQLESQLDHARKSWSSVPNT